MGYFQMFQGMKPKFHRTKLKFHALKLFGRTAASYTYYIYKASRNRPIHLYNSSALPNLAL